VLQLSHPFRNFVLEIYLTQTRMGELLASDFLIPMWHLLLMHLPKSPWPTESLSLLGVLSAYPWSSKAMFHMSNFSFTCTSSHSITWDGSWIYLWSWDTWKTLWRLERDGGNAIWYATGPTLLRIWKGPIKRGVSFWDFNARPTPVHRVTLKNTDRVTRSIVTLRMLPPKFFSYVTNQCLCGHIW